MVNVNKLRGKIVEKGMNISILAENIGIDRATLYRKLGGNGSNFSIKDADSISKALELTISEVNEIFFAQYVA